MTDFDLKMLRERLANGDPLNDAQVLFLFQEIATLNRHLAHAEKSEVAMTKPKRKPVEAWALLTADREIWSLQTDNWWPADALAEYTRVRLVEHDPDLERLKKAAVKWKRRMERGYGAAADVELAKAVERLQKKEKR